LTRPFGPKKVAHSGTSLGSGYNAFVNDSESEARRPRTWAGGRLVYFVLGWFFFGLGVLGAMLPLLPTTPFMLLAAWGFGRSSPRFERWLLEHRWFGPSIVRWRAHRVVPARVKMVSYATMLVTFTLSAISGRLSWWALAAQAALMGYGAWYIARLPSKPPDDFERVELMGETTRTSDDSR
jgi:uncharacterized membrane protein YbaN (DUF454 family)